MSKRRILVVEDDCALASQYRSALAFAGFDVDVASDGLSALENIEGRGLVLIGADLRGATFNNLNPREMDLTGVRVDAEQGMLLLQAMGIRFD